MERRSFLQGALLIPAFGGALASLGIVRNRRLTEYIVGFGKYYRFHIFTSEDAGIESVTLVVNGHDRQLQMREEPLVNGNGAEKQRWRTFSYTDSATITSVITVRVVSADTIDIDSVWCSSTKEA